MNNHRYGRLHVDRSKGDDREIINHNGEAIATAACQECAALIVVACNAHDDLLAACKAAQGVCDTMGVGMVAFRVNEVGDQLRAAIAKAEG